MSDNVIIFGAGASADAKVPLMRDFVQKMWEMSVRGKVGAEKLTLEDLDLMREAMGIKETLDNYHGRVRFDDRDLEDILSILSFDAMVRGSVGRRRLSTFIRAISRTIELTCVVQHNGEPRYYGGCPSQYTEFWGRLIKDVPSRGGMLPTIITFNYDLVLERSLYHFFSRHAPDQLPVDGVSILYHYGKLPRVDLRKTLRTYTYPGDRKSEGAFLDIGAGETSVHLEILKLHGSVNFPRTVPAQQSLPVLATDNPLIVPPIFSKMEYGRGLNGAWTMALQRLREAKNIIIVGYSLPKTDIYMQYFLKAGLGPNKDLNQIFVFDPVLCNDDEPCHAMIQRYKTCFSPQFQDRIVFGPPGMPSSSRHSGFKHFVDRFHDVFFWGN